MNRTTRVRAIAIRALLASSLSLGTVAHAHAASSAPGIVWLVGHDGAGSPDPAGVWRADIRDIAGNPVPGSVVTIDLSLCTDLRLAAIQPYPGMTVDCAAKTVSATSDGQGVARFCIVGGAVNPGGAPGPGLPSVRISSDGTVFRFNVIVAAFDQDGFDGLGAIDLSAWFTDFFAGGYLTRSDYDGSGFLTSMDLSLWFSRYFSGGSRAGAGSLPGGLCP